MKSQKIDDIMVKVFNNRRRIFYESNNKEMIKKHEKTFQKIQQLIESIQQIKNEKIKLMLSYLMINVTKFMEQNYINCEGTNRFEWKKQPQWLIEVILQYGVEELKENKISIQNFRQIKALPFVKQRLKNRIKLLSEIAKQEISWEQLDDYFKQIKIIEFSHHSCSTLKTISSYDGKYIFIESDLKSKAFDIESLEKGTINNFFYWLIKNNNPYLIINEIFDVNKYLDLEFNHFYCHKAYDHSYQECYNFTFIKSLNL